MRILKSIIMIFALIATMAVNAQTQTPITSVHGSVSDDMGPLMGATVCEMDGNGRIIESTITDLNGNFTMRVRNPKDRIRFSYVGMKTVTQARHEEFAEPTRWSLLNAFTEYAKKYSPGRADVCYRGLTSLFGLDGNRPDLWK